MIDFDDCGFGYYDFDIAIALNSLSKHKNSKNLKKALLEAYKDDSLDMQSIQIFLAARKIVELGWLNSRSHIPRIKNHIPQTAKDMTRECRKILK